MKQIEYTIEAKLLFDIDKDIEIESYLNQIREVGKAKVINVKIIDTLTNRDNS